MTIEKFEKQIEFFENSMISAGLAKSTVTGYLNRFRFLVLNDFVKEPYIPIEKIEQIISDFEKAALNRDRYNKTADIRDFRSMLRKYTSFQNKK